MTDIKEFEISMVVYHLQNKYTLDEINDMLIELFESKGMYCGGSIKEVENKD